MELIQAIEQHQHNDQRKQRMVIECLCKVKSEQRQKGSCHAAARAGDAEEKGKGAAIEQEDNEKDGSKLRDIFYYVLSVQRSTSKEKRGCSETASFYVCYVC